MITFFPILCGNDSTIMYGIHDNHFEGPYHFTLYGNKAWEYHDSCGNENVLIRGIMKYSQIMESSVYQMGNHL